MSGLHINELKQQHLDYIAKVRPAVNLLMNPKAEQVAEIKGRSPASKLIGRPYIKDGDLHDSYLKAGTAEGARQAGKNAAQLCLDQRVPDVDAWIVLNEPPVKEVEQVRLLAEFDSEFARQMSRGTSKACIGAFSRGTPEIPALGGGAILTAYAPALRIAYDVGAWLAIHQYGKYPLMADAQYLALRWQTHILPWYRSQGVPIPRYVMTEYGLDMGAGIDAQNQDGWRASPYAANFRDYAEHLLQLAQEYAKDPTCIGATVFCAGYMGWQSFAVDGPLLDYMTGLVWPSFTGIAAPAPTPSPIPSPMPVPAPTPTPDIKLPEWVKVTQAQAPAGQKVWRLAKAEYWDEAQSKGLHHIYIAEPHAPEQRAIVTTINGQSWEIPLDKPANEPAGNFAMSGIPNSYSVQMKGFPSDKVEGLAMIGNRHVSYRLWWELVTVATPVPTPQPTPTPERPTMPTLIQRLQQEFGNKFVDLRDSLPKHKNAKGERDKFFNRVDSRLMSHIILHYSTGNPVPVSPLSIANYHIFTNGWAEIGYHFVIDQGVLYYVGDVDTARAHVKNRNHEALGVCFTGIYDTELPSSADTDICKRLITRVLDPHYGHKKALAGHWQFMPDGRGHTDCPGRIVELIPVLRAPVPAPAPAPKPTRPPLPEDEIVYVQAGDLKTYLQKTTYWQEEYIRELAAKRYARAGAIRLSLAKLLAAGRDRWAA